MTLLLQRDDEAAQAEINAIMPRVRAAIQEKIEEGRLDFWDLAAGLQLAAIARDWPGAERGAVLAMAQAPSEWMLETTMRDLRAIGEKFDNPEDRRRLEDILEFLRKAHARVETSE